MTKEDIPYAQTTDALSEMLGDFCEAHALPWISADELLLKLVDQMAELKQQCDWLIIFCAHWDAVQSREDFEEMTNDRSSKE